MNQVPYISREEIEAKALQTLTAAGALRVPVPLDLLAHRMGLSLEGTELGDGVSGVLVVDGGKGSIGYSAKEAEVRQRFTVAHEIGHFKMHLQAEGTNLFIDKTYVYRDQASSTGEVRQEIQANMFAAALLMPKELLLRELEQVDFDLGNEDTLQYLAKRFDVSVQSMSIRLANLGIFGESDRAIP